MTRDDVTRLAHEAAGFDGTTSLERPIVLYAAMSKDFLDKFADLVAKQEREACAKVCDAQAEKDNFEGCYANACAEAIRARSEKPPVKSYCGGKPNYCTPEQKPLTLLPDGSAFGVMSFPLPKSHWLYAEREYRDGEYEPVELGKPILTHELRGAVVSAVRYAIRGATNCGKEMDFDPDALVQNAVYALCGPYTAPLKREWVGLTDDEYDELMLSGDWGGSLIQATQAKLKEKNGG
jgi:hypothetical protein